MIRPLKYLNEGAGGVVALLEPILDSAAGSLKQCSCLKLDPTAEEQGWGQGEFC